jgi:Tfp pilus assembly protein PilF
MAAFCLPLYVEFYRFDSIAYEMAVEPVWYLYITLCDVLCFVGGRRCAPAHFFLLASIKQQDYHPRNVKKQWLIALVGALIFCTSASAQQPSAARQSVTARGQVYAPNGEPLHVVIRMELSGEDGQRPPYKFFTDSKGTFVINEMVQGATYTLIVETDGKTWASTSQTIFISGTRPFVTVQLRPIEHTPSSATSASVSVAELNQNVPRAARREYDAAVEQLSEGNAERARKSFERAIELFPDFVGARSELAALMMREGELAPAEVLLRRAVEIDSAAALPLFNLGLCLYRQQRYADALPFLERGVQLQPVNANGNLIFGMTLVMAGDDARAEPVLRKAYELGGKHYAKAQLYLSRLYTRQKKYDRAAEALDAYLRDLPDVPDAEALRATLVKLRAAANP